MSVGDIISTFGLASLAIIDEQYHQSVVNLLKALKAGLVAGCGLDDERAANLAAVALTKWAAGDGNVHPRTRRLAQEALAKRRPVVPFFHEPQRSGQRSDTGYVVVPSVAGASRKGRQ